MKAQRSKGQVTRRHFLTTCGLLTGAAVLGGPLLRWSAAQGTIKIGTLIPLTGPLAEFGPNFQRA
ncbi:MAG: ABC transporter substrate-binding protein, partial [Nitrospinota bacterium]